MRQIPIDGTRDISGAGYGAAFQRRHPGAGGWNAGSFRPRQRQNEQACGKRIDPHPPLRRYIPYARGRTPNGPVPRLGAARRLSLNDDNDLDFRGQDQQHPAQGKAMGVSHHLLQVTAAGEFRPPFLFMGPVDYRRVNFGRADLLFWLGHANHRPRSVTGVRVQSRGFDQARRNRLMTSGKSPLHCITPMHPGDLQTGSTGRINRPI
jgi:hypothetical protein